MARTPKPATAHKPNDFCTIAQAEYIAGLVANDMIRRYEQARRFNRPHRKLARFLKRKLGVLRGALRLSRS